MGFGGCLTESSVKVAEDRKGGKVLLERHLYCPDDNKGYVTEVRCER